MTLQGTISRSVALVGFKEKKLIVLAMIFQASLAILDLVGIAALGLTTSIVINDKYPKLLLTLWPALQKDPFPNDGQISILLALTVFLFLLRSFLSSILLNRTSKFLGSISVKLSIKYSQLYFKQSLIEIAKDKPEQTAFSLGTAFTIAILEVLGSLISLVAEFALLTSIVVLLLFINLGAAVLTITYFLLIFLLTNLVLRVRQQSLSLKRNQANIQATTDVILIQSNLREITLYNLLDKFLQRFGNTRRIESASSQGIFILNQIPKYIYESSFYIGLAITFIYLVITGSGESATTQFAIFLAAGSRLMPSLVRIQNCIATIHQADGPCENMFCLVRKLNRNSAIPATKNDISTLVLREKSLITINNLEYSYTPKSLWKLQIPQLNINFGDRILVAGESGSGKSTFVDLLLGLLTPTHGSIHYSSEILGSEDKINPGAIGYVPQRVNLFKGSVLENITFFGSEPDAKLKTERILEKIALGPWLASLPRGVETEIENFGTNLSGGQAHRIGVARALYRDPRLLILDEPTSALDSTTELRFIDELFQISSEVTIIAISHSAQMQQRFEKILEFKDGSVSIRA